MKLFTKAALGALAMASVAFAAEPANAAVSFGLESDRGITAAIMAPRITTEPIAPITVPTTGPIGTDIADITDRDTAIAIGPIVGITATKLHT